MNPNAIVFVPSIKLDPEQERSEQIQNIQRQIIYQKQLIQTKNVALTTLHSHLDAKHSVLVNQMKRRENNEFPCFTQTQIDALGKEYQADSKIYYEKYAEFNDATSELVTLQQQLHKLLIINNSCSPPSSPKNTLRVKASDNNNNKKKIDKDFAKRNKLSVKIFDGIDPKILSPKGTATMTTPQNVLPPIIEDDDENAWNDDDDECDVGIAINDQCPSMNSSVIDEYNQSMMTNHSHKSSPESVSPTPTPTPFTFPDVNKNENGDEKEYYHDVDKENINPNPKRIKAPFDSDEKVNINNRNKKCNNNNHSKRIIPDYIAFENKIHTMLENIQYAEVNKPCDDMVQVINTLCVNCKCVEILIDMIISHAVEHKPIFFGAKYSLICQSIVNNYKPNRDIVINDDIDEYQKMKALNVSKLVYKSCNETFKKLSYGNDTVKFINVMIIIAELFNANLLDADYIFNTVFQSILCDSHYHDLWENDIEGIFEIFQRCTRHLTQSQHKESLYRYVRIMDKIKSWKKFDSGLRRVPFMVNQLKKLVNYKSLDRQFAHQYNDNNHYNGNRYNNNNYYHRHNHDNNNNKHHFRASYHHRRNHQHNNYHHHQHQHQHQRNHNRNNDHYQKKHETNHNNNSYRRYNNNKERDVAPRHFNAYNNNNHNSYRRKW